LGVLLASSSAWAQSGEWRDWASARYAWDTDREELEGERARNERLRAELGLPLLDLQPESAMLTPPGPGGRRESAGLEPLPVDRGPLTPRLEPVQPARGFDDEPPRSTSRVITTPDPVVVEEDPRLSREDERRRRADEERLRKEEERLRRDEEKARAQEEKVRRAQEDKLRRDEERRAAEEEEKRRAEEERLRRIEEARQETLRKKQEEEEKKKKAEAERKKKEEEEKRLQQLLKEKTNDRGQVVDDELKDLLDEAE
jgi:hypothetical protein